MIVDLNCDMGESFGAWTMGRDAELLQYATSANIACGAHAGDPATMRRTVQLALEAGAAIGAHPGLPDLQGFGRRELAITPDEAYELVLAQVGALHAFVKAAGGTLVHVKPHGALYTMAAVRRPLADAIARAVRDFDDGLVLLGLAGSALVAAGEAHGLAVAQEAFADRTYQPDGTLTPRSRADALHHDTAAAVAQVLRLVREGTVLATDGTPVRVQADSLCLHGDGAHAVAFAAAIRTALRDAEIAVRPLTRRPA